MSTHPILIHPDKRLRRTAEPVTDFDEELADITAAMFATMYNALGIGLAATQVNLQRRIVVIDLTKKKNGENEGTDTPERDKHILINPEVLTHSEETVEYEEGCLSLPGQYANVSRPAQIHFTWQDLHGERHEAEADGLLAACVQHEIDHLDGVLFIDHLSRLKRERIEKKLAKSRQRA